eukprot:s3646_g3.t1
MPRAQEFWSHIGLLTVCLKPAMASLAEQEVQEEEVPLTQLSLPSDVGSDDEMTGCKVEADLSSGEAATGPPCAAGTTETGPTESALTPPEFEDEPGIVGTPPSVPTPKMNERKATQKPKETRKTTQAAKGLKKPAAATPTPKAKSVNAKKITKKAKDGVLHGCSKCRWCRIGCKQCRGWAQTQKFGYKFGPNNEVISGCH